MCLFPSFLRAYFSDSKTLQTVKDVSELDPIVDLLESIESILKHLDICAKVPHTAAMTETVVKTLVELLSILGLVTKFVKQGEYLLIAILSDSVQHRDVWRVWRKFRSDGAGKVGSTHPGRGSDHRRADS